MSNLHSNVAHIVSEKPQQLGYIPILAICQGSSYKFHVLRSSGEVSIVIIIFLYLSKQLYQQVHESFTMAQEENMFMETILAINRYKVSL